MAEMKISEDQELSEILKIRREKLKALQEAGMDPFVQTRFDRTALSQQIKDNYDSCEGKQVAIAGRMMVKRLMGKASFCKISDREGLIQCYVARDSLGEDAYAGFKKLDIERRFVSAKAAADTVKENDTAHIGIYHADAE